MARRPSLAVVVWQLTSTYTERTTRDYDSGGTRYTEQHPSEHGPLILQLWSSVDPSGQGGEVGSSTATSKPAANLEAMAAGADIDLAVARWLTDLGEQPVLDRPDPRHPGQRLAGSGTIAGIRRLHGLTASVSRCDEPRANRSDSGRVTCCTWHAIDVDVRRWWVRARVLTGHDSPAWKPDATCPLCATRGKLVVRMAASVATCTACHETWDTDTIGLLADHIRAESQERRFAPAEPVQSCHPMTVEERAELDSMPRMILCPDCGSRWCVKVFDQPVGRLRSHRPTG